MSLSHFCFQGELFVGDQSGAIHIWDLKTDHNEQLVRIIRVYLYYSESKSDIASNLLYCFQSVYLYYRDRSRSEKNRFRFRSSINAALHAFTKLFLPCGKKKDILHQFY